MGILFYRYSTLHTDCLTAVDEALTLLHSVKSVKTSLDRVMHESKVSAVGAAAQMQSIKR